MEIPEDLIPQLEANRAWLRLSLHERRRSVNSVEAVLREQAIEYIERIAALEQQLAEKNKTCIAYTGLKAEYDALMEYIGGHTQYPDSDWERTLIDEVKNFTHKELAQARAEIERLTAPTESDPLRYSFMWDSDQKSSGMFPFPSGEWVSWQDYCALRERMSRPATEIALAAAREISSCFSISIPRGMSYSNGILHTIRIIIETHLNGQDREFLAARARQQEQK